MLLTSNDPNIRYIEKHFNVQRDEDIIDKLRIQVDVYEDSVYHYHKMIEIAFYKDSVARQLIKESNRIKGEQERRDALVPEKHITTSICVLPSCPCLVKQQKTLTYK